MILTRVLIKGYRSFNFDYKKKYLTNSKNFQDHREYWEKEANYEKWKPWVQVPIHMPITTIVGANESGKSHLLDSVIKCLKGDKLESEDVCRYSDEFDIGNMGYAKIGLIFKDISENILSLINKYLDKSNENNQEKQEEADSKIKLFDKIDSLGIIRENKENISLLIFTEKEHNPYEIQINPEQFIELQNELPNIVRISPRTFLPSKIQIATLIKIALKENNDQDINKFLSSDLGKMLYKNKEGYNAINITENDYLVFRLLKYCANIELDGLCRIPNASEQLLKEFSAQATEKIEDILNLGHWWAQDVDVRINIDLRNNEIILNITDRTKSWYGLSERSQGMRYFLGYLIQILIELKSNSKSMIIISDEPDFALSAIADLRL